MRPFFSAVLSTGLMLAAGSIIGPVQAEVEARPRLLVTTDIGGDPDDQQSLIRLLLFSCDLEIEGLVASASGTPGELKEQVTRPELIREWVDAYAAVYPSLRQHRTEYPEPDALRAVIKSGNPNRHREAIGDEHDTEGSEWIVRCLDREDARPLCISIWGGQTDVAQALWRIRADRGQAGLDHALSRLWVHDIMDQDRIFDWMLSEFPGLKDRYILNAHRAGEDKRNAGYRGMYLGGDESLTSGEWILAHVKDGHGPLGALYPMKTWTAPNPHGCLKEGDTPSWFYFLENGLQSFDHPGWGGWGGRFERDGRGVWMPAEDRPAGGEADRRAAVNPWRPAFQHAFAARMDWCVQPPAEANHAPVAVLNSDPSRAILERAARPGDEVALSAAGSTDPDADPLAYRWWMYPEASTGAAEIRGSEEPEAVLAVGDAEPGSEIHVILEVTDDGTPPLTAYRRIVVRVEEE